MRKRKITELPTAEELLLLLGSHGRPLRTDGILAFSGQPPHLRKKIEKLLRQLRESGQVSLLPGGFWTAAQEPSWVTGEFNASANGSGKVKVLDPPNYPPTEIFISPYQTGAAWHKDKVRALILPGSSGTKGKVLEVVERGLKEIPAVLSGRHKKSLLFKPADNRINAVFKVEKNSPHAAEIHPGELAILKPLRELGDNEWLAEIDRIAGPLNRIAAQESIVKLNQQVPTAFPKLALDQAAALPPAPSKSDMKDREDWRSLPFVTIDGADARDFDDAIHVEKTDNGWILRVAIADVAHYVQPDSRKGSLDSEACSRGNSWYFPTSVEPMLPKAISNGLCSLKPNEDRLAMMVEIPFDSSGNPGNPRFTEIVMRSAARLVYEDVAAFLDGQKNALPSPDCSPMLQDAHALFRQIAKRRRENGTLDFLLPEPVYKFDENGRLLEMGERTRNDAHMLIEEFMIAANEAVASWLESHKQDFLYRIHPRPEPEKLTRLYETLEQIAPECLPKGLDRNEEPSPSIIQEILARAAGTPQEYVVNRLCLRSMSQARYQPQNIGHFGLASKSYCHFTSPIRRYADLLTHRALKKALGAKKEIVPTIEELVQLGNQLNNLERRAVECEREIAKRLGCLYLEGREGETFKGVISGVTDFGLFVEFKDFPAEGLMRTEELGNDWYRVDNASQSLIGEFSGQVWRLGQPVDVKLLSINPERQEVRLAPVHRQKERTQKRRNERHFQKQDKTGRRGMAKIGRSEEARKKRAR